MAMVLGIYDRLISSVSRVFKEPKQSIPFLLWFALGGAGVSCSFPEASACCLPQKRQFRPGSSF